MASDRIRLTISITPEVHAIFTRMAETAGMSLGKCIGDWLTDTSEGAVFVAQKMADARRAPSLVMREMHSMALGLVDETAKAMDQVRSRRAVPTAPEAASARAARPSPPASNTGGKVPGQGKRGRRS